ncbi:uncharacterized protein H6S33_000170 [Morchella sextelata]|uniref:uncharacterized protein n=1 Tax=Morchella sextelata TaxID=1174677 RepID=UPI001D056D21|nr:uncharacterized protein H6S33_000170 [Morchella sextelata]KAH0614534.1 hypothetical protein H6S33_000170 [Morchella sextelata]
MSIDLNWETLTSGPDGARYAERVRDFVHTKFQTIPFPKFIKSVHVHSFTFGTIPPDIEIKEICDPYPEFYEEDEDDYAETDSDPEDDAAYSLKLERERRRRERRNDDSGSAPSTPSVQPPPYSLDGGRASGPGAIAGFRGAFSPGIPDTFPGRVGVTGVSTPLFNRAGSNSNLHYFHSALSTGFTTAGGTSTPTLSAFVSPPPSVIPARASTAASTGSVPSPPSTADSADHERDPTTPPPLPQAAASDSPLQRSSAPSIMPRLREPRDEDTQIISRVRYAGDVRLELTAELLLEYPVSAFAALPVRLVVTGCRFDGLACLAYIRRRAHFCFLDEERGGGEGGAGGGGSGSLLKEIKVESEIGEKGRGKQVLKNVGKVERFVLEQVRRIFEEEFVFPSSWTFLV